MDQKRKSFHHIITKTINIHNKDRILKAAKEKGQVIYKGRPIKITLDFSTETLKARRAWTEVFSKKNHRMQPILLYPTKSHEENKIFQDKTKFRQYHPQIQPYRLY